MKNVFSLGDQKSFEVKVMPHDTATFESGSVHPVYATFALGRDAEWCCRLFVLEMKEADEEGIGTLLNIEHVSPALVGSDLVITATLVKLEGNEIICSYEVTCAQRLIAKGLTGQKILKKVSLEKIFSRIS